VGRGGKPFYNRMRGYKDSCGNFSCWASFSCVSFSTPVTLMPGSLESAPAWPRLHFAADSPARVTDGYETAFPRVRFPLNKFQFLLGKLRDEPLSFNLEA
jgi:hypothetical protein